MAMKLKIALIIWFATMVVLSAAPVDQKNSHGPLSLGQAIESLEKTKLKSEGNTVEETRDGKKITIEHYRFDTSGLVFGDLPVSSAHVDIVAGSIVHIYILLDSDLVEEVQKQNPSDLNSALKERWRQSSEKRRLLSLAMIEKYGPPKKTASADPSAGPSEFFWEGEDVGLTYYLTSPLFNDGGALVDFESKRAWDKAITASLEAQNRKAADEKEKAQKLKDKF